MLEFQTTNQNNFRNSNKNQMKKFLGLKFVLSKIIIGLKICKIEKALSRKDLLLKKIRVWIYSVLTHINHNNKKIEINIEEYYKE